MSFHRNISLFRPIHIGPMKEQGFRPSHWFRSIPVDGVVWTITYCDIYFPDSLRDEENPYIKWSEVKKYAMEAGIFDDKGVSIHRWKHLLNFSIIL